VSGTREVLRARLGTPRAHFRQTDSTNERARQLAIRGAPHGTLVTAAAQSAGRGRQGRTWMAPPGRALLCSVVVREPPQLLPLLAGVAVAEVVDELAAGDTKVKWPNDVLLAGRKVAGILVEGRTQERWSVLGVGLNVAVREEDFPAELRRGAGTLGLDRGAIEPTLVRLLRALDRWLVADESVVLDTLRALDALAGQPVRWAHGEGTATGIDGSGRLIVVCDGRHVALDAGEVHLRP